MMRRFFVILLFIVLCSLFTASPVYAKLTNLPPGSPPDSCPVPNYDTDRCCPFKFSVPSSFPNLLNTLLGAILKAEITLKDEFAHAHVKELKERYIGTPEEDFDDGVAKKLMPPTHSFVESAAERERVKNELAKWEIEVEGMKEGEEKGKIEGADEHLYSLNYATNFLSDALTKVPGEETASLNPPPFSTLADRGAVLAGEMEELCHDILPGVTHETCVNEREMEISLTKAIGSILGGKIKIFPRLSFLEDIFHQTVETTFAIFDVPGETHKYWDAETEGDFEIVISLTPFGFEVPLWRSSVTSEAQVWQTGTVRDVDVNSIQQKLTPPGF